MSRRSSKAEDVRTAACGAGVIAAVALSVGLGLMTLSAIAVAERLAPGDLDPSFGNGGSIVLPEFPFLATTHSTLLVRADGKLIVGTLQGIPFQLESNGMPDSSYQWQDVSDRMFRRCVSLGGGCDFTSMALQGDGKLVVGLMFKAFADGSRRFGVARFNTDGTLDLSFGSEGVGLTDPVAEGNGTFAVTLLPDGKILVGATTFPILIGNRLAFARFTQDGSVDNSFGAGGVVVTSIDGLPRTLLPLADGAVVVVAVVDAGPAAPYAVPKTLLVKLLPNGGFDPQFGNGGSVVEDSGGGSTWPSKAVLQTDGSILVALRHGLEGSPGGIRQFTLMRLLANGAEDNSFGTAGKVAVQVGEDGSEAQAEDVALQPDGKIVVAGTVSQVFQPLGFRRIALARFNRDGSLDPFFAPGGVSLAWSNFGADGYAVAIQPSGRIVVAGEVERPPFFSCCDLGAGSWHQSTSTAVFGFIGGDAPVAPTRQARLNQHGMTGSWFQMATAGQGVEVEVYPDLVAPGTGFMQAAWFTYDYKAPGGPASQRWYSFSGNVQSGQPSAALTLYENTGGNFNTPPVTRAKPVGSVVVSAADCDHLTMLYTFTDGSGRSGIVPMMRLLRNVTCAASGPETPNADFGYSGNWFEETTSGQGIVLELNPNQPLAWLTWYTYAQNGQSLGEGGQRWYTAQAAYTPGTRIVPMTLYETTGGLFDKPAPTPATVPIGTITATFISCTALKLDYNFTGGSSAGASGTINMTRVGPTPAGCGP